MSWEHLSTERCPELHLVTQASDLPCDMLSVRKTQSLKAKPVNHRGFVSNISICRIMRVFISQTSACESEVRNWNPTLLKDPRAWDLFWHASVSPGVSTALSDPYYCIQKCKSKLKIPFSPISVNSLIGYCTGRLSFTVLESLIILSSGWEDLPKYASHIFADPISPPDCFLIFLGGRFMASQIGRTGYYHELLKVIIQAKRQMCHAFWRTWLDVVSIPWTRVPAL